MSEARQKKQFIRSAVTWLVVFVVLAGGIALFASSRGQVPASSLPADVSASLSTVRDDDWIKGSKDAPLVLIEYSDFQCPACGYYYPLVKKFAEENMMRVAVVYRHFPLTQIHKNGMLASLAAQAAGKQDKFWQMHDILFERQQEWSDADAKQKFLQYAGELGLDVAQFEKDLNSREVRDRVQRDIESGTQAGVQGTPTFFLNGKLIETPRSYDEFKQLVERVQSL